METKRKVRDLVGQAKEELYSEYEKRRLGQVKEAMREITATKKNLAEMELQYEALLDEPIDDAVFED